MKQIKNKIIVLLIVFSLLLNFNATVFANGFESNVLNQQSKQIYFSELPKEYQEIISPKAVIYKQPDGSYDIFQDKSVLSMKENLTKSNLVSPLGLPDSIYAPNGGSFTDLENGKISTFTYVVYQTYLPRDKVDEWICDQVPGLRSYIIGFGLELGIGKASTIAEKVLLKYGVSLSTTAIIAIIQGAVFTLNWLNYKQVETASDKGKYGILIEYLTNIGGDNVRVYSRWNTGGYVNKLPYGGSAIWHPNNYYVMP